MTNYALLIILSVVIFTAMAKAPTCYEPPFVNAQVQNVIDTHCAETCVNALVNCETDCEMGTKYMLQYEKDGGK